MIENYQVGVSRFGDRDHSHHCNTAAHYGTFAEWEWLTSKICCSTTAAFHTAMSTLNSLKRFHAFILKNTSKLKLTEEILRHALC